MALALTILLALAYVSLVTGNLRTLRWMGSIRRRDQQTSDVDMTDSLYRKVGVTDSVNTKPSAGKVVTKTVVTKRWQLTPPLITGTSGLGMFGSGQNGAEEVRRALESLGRITLPKINPADPQSVREAIRQMDHDIDAKLGAYPQNKIVAEAARKLKSDLHQMIQEQVQTLARSATEKK